MKALGADVEGMVTLGKKLQESLGSAKNVHITTELGTDLHLTLAETGVAVDCGRWDPMLNVDNIIYMPSGNVVTVPVETSANGLVVVPVAYLRRAHSGWIRGLQLQFHEGKVNLKTVRAKSGVRIFKKILEETTGDKNVIAEFAIGLNPNVQKLIGSMTVDEMMGGSVRIAIGDNYGWMKGKNKSNLHWDFILPEATMELEGKTILKLGEFQFGR
jgi:leucyl aminopeptidase (aminopeptidase T)